MGTMASCRVASAKCVFCDNIAPAERGQMDMGPSGSNEVYWICDACTIAKAEKNRVVDTLLLVQESKALSTNAFCQLTLTDKSKINQKPLGNDTSSKNAGRNGKKPEAVRTYDADGEKNGENESDCSCQACVERKRLEQEQMRENQDLQKCWLQLRHAFRQMYRYRLLKGGVSGKGKKFDLAKLSQYAAKLCYRDPHQLYQRLESLAREHIMELKVQLLQVLVCAENKLNPSDDASLKDRPANDEVLAARITPEIAEFFLLGLLSCAGELFETVENMKEFLSVLDINHLERFGISWKTVNYDLFDAIIYDDPLLRAMLPTIYSQLGFEFSPTGEVIIKPQEHVQAADVVKSFLKLGMTVGECRVQMEKAQDQMGKYISQQMRIYKATLKAKQKILKNDLEYFKQQRRRLEEYVSKRKLQVSSSEKTDCDINFVDALQSLLSGNRPNKERIECDNCHQTYCSCDECSVSHLIACGLLSNDLDPHERMQILHDLNDSGDSSCSESDDSECGSVNGDETLSVVQTRVFCNDGHVARLETTIVPAPLFSLRGAENSPHSVRRHMSNAYGGWEVSGDPASLIFASRWKSSWNSKCFTSKAPAASEKDEPPTDPSVHDANCKKKHSCSDIVAEGFCRRSLKSKSCVKDTNVPSECKGRCHDVIERSTPSPLSHAELRTNRTGSKEPRDHTKRHYSPACANSGKSPVPAKRESTSRLTNIQNERLAEVLLNYPAAGNVDALYKTFNLDVDEIKRICAQRGDVVAALAKYIQQSKSSSTAEAREKKSSCKNGDKTGDTMSIEDDDDDSWSDRSSVLSQKDDKHCDCCYCEMFGHGTMDFQRHCGRDEYPQIRERLRLKLKKKESETPSQRSENVDGYRGYQSVDALLEYINGSSKKHAMQTKLASPSTKSAKSVKKNRTKAKRPQNEQKMRASNDSAQSCSPFENDPEEENICKVRKDTGASNGVQSRPSHENGEPNGTLTPKTAAANHQLRRRNKANQNGNSLEDVNIDEVFKPKDIDLDSTEMDEAEREVESFKRFVMDCQPRANREKVQLDIGNLLRYKKATTAVS